MGLLAAGGMSAQTSYTPSTLTKDGGTYYVYNPLTKLWLQNNNTVVNGYTTGLNVGTIGLPFTFTIQASQPLTQDTTHGSSMASLPAMATSMVQALVTATCCTWTIYIIKDGMWLR